MNTSQDEYSYPLHMLGAASPLPPPDDDDPVARLHTIVKEVTGKPVAVPTKPRIGFLP